MNRSWKSGLGLVVTGGLVALPLGFAAIGNSPSKPGAAFAQGKASAPASQQAAFADGKITLVEYRTAADTSRKCVAKELTRRIADAGYAGKITVTQGTLATSKDQFRVEYSFGFEYADDVDVEGDLAQYQHLPGEVDKTCQKAHLANVQYAYQSTLMSDTTFRKGVEANLASCFRTGGITVPPSAMGKGDPRNMVMAASQSFGGDVNKAPPAFSACLTQYPSVLDIPSL